MTGSTLPPGPPSPGPEDDDLGVTIPDDLSSLEGLPSLDGVTPLDDAGPRAGVRATDDVTSPEDVAPADEGTSADEGGSPDERTSPDGPPRGAPADPEAEKVVALLVTQVDGAGPLAAACALSGVDADTVPSPIGALAVLREVSEPAQTTAAAESLSRMLRGAPVLLLDRRGGRISASRWVDGGHQDDLAAGLVMSGAPEVLEDLLLGGTAARDVEGHATSVGMSRWAAMRALAAGRRRRG